MKLTTFQKKTLNQLPFDQLNKMQEAFITNARSHQNLMLLSPTGSGKTFAFLFPLLERLNPKLEGVQALIIVPSRELALQIEQVFKSMKTGFKVNAVYGGHAIKTERNNFSEPPAVLVGTPGRIDDHLNRKNFDPKTIQTLILDEFDKALEFGFQEEMKAIIKRLVNIKQRYLTSATAIGSVPHFVGAKECQIVDFSAQQKVKGLSLFEVRAEENDKLQVLFELVCTFQNDLTLVFCNHREAVDRISKLLSKNEIENSVFHGGLNQNERERALVKFRNGTSTLLITTDLAARGLDIPEIQNVVHYQLPPKEDAYIHRNGRTARMHEKGAAFLVLSELENIPEYINTEVAFKKLEEEIIIPPATEWKTIYVGGGKKDKINKIDLVGFFMKKGMLKKDELGKIEVFDQFSYAAIKANKVQQVLKRVTKEKIKKRKVKIALSK
ncbi:MAG: DEAD/DEAH box helicase [Flavobacteriales bacterium]|jgi:ATP-independent RNA helicase DbpA|nr:DEAD/DEAH box helicase [Flavobacteriales bacterium]